VIKVTSYIKLRRDLESDSFSSETFLRFMAVSLCLGLPPLVAGLVAPIAITYFFPSVKTEAKIEQPQTASVEKKSADYQKELMVFNKTNYVGDGEDYRRGSDNAKTVVQMFSDFGCPHCKVANDFLLKAQDLIGLDKVVVVYRFFPLSNDCNPYVSSKGWYAYSCSLANMVRCAGQQNKFWEFKEWAFSAQDLSDKERALQFSTAGVKQEAEKLGIQFDSFNQCVESGVEFAKIKNDSAFANKLGIQGTPMIFINGVEYKGPHSVDDFVRVIQEAS
jgi:protein-disulfide isomerase